MLLIKESPEDFVVKEVADFDLKNSGEHAYFKLWKKNLTTFEAVKEVAKLLKVKKSNISFAGLKDKRAVTEQFISVKGLKDVKEISEENLKLTFLGYSDRPIRIGDIKGNVFRVKVKSTKRLSKSKLIESADLVKAYGFENYFGEQRFGSVRYAQDFITRYLLRNDYEGALKEYLTAMNDKRRRKALLKAWGRWKEFLKLLPSRNSEEAKIVRNLSSGMSFREAFERIPKKLKLMLLFAYQSYLWNTYLSRFVSRYLKHFRVNFLRWSLAFSEEINPSIFEEIKDLEIPYLGTDYPPKSKKVEIIIREVLEEEGLRQEDLKAVRGGVALFSDGVRKAFASVRDLEIEDFKPREVTLSFFLPPGSYATVLLIKIFRVPVK